MRAALYPRVSTEKQEKEGYSIGEQIDRMESFCKAKGWTVHKIYTDAGYSGATTERPALQHLLHDAEHHQFDVVVVYKLDRLSRSQKDTLSIIQEQLLPNGVDFVSVLESFLDTSTPYGIAMIGILAVFAEMERSTFAIRSAEGRRGRAKAGLWHGSSKPPVGYRYVDGRLVVDDYEAVQVKELFRLFNMRIAPMRIMKILNDKGYRTSYGKWTRRGLKPMISNRVYIGLVSYSDEWYEGEHEAIIDTETFLKAQEILVEHLDNHRRKPKYESPIAGIVKCGWCNSNYFIRADVARKDGSKPRFFTCYARTCFHGKWGKIPKDERCRNKNYRVEDLEKIVLGEIERLALHPDSFITTEKPDGNDEVIHSINKRLAEIEKRLDRLLDLYDEGKFDLNKVNKKAEPLNEEKSRLTLELKKLKAEPKLEKAEAVEMALTLRDILPNATPDEVRAIVSELIESVVIDGDDQKIYWRF